MLLGSGEGKTIILVVLFKLFDCGRLPFTSGATGIGPSMDLKRRTCNTIRRAGRLQNIAKKLVDQ
jgi:hypothetical protein